MALRAEVVDLVGAVLLEEQVERGAVVEVAVVEEEAAAGLVRVLESAGRDRAKARSLAPEGRALLQVPWLAAPD